MIIILFTHYYFSFSGIIHYDPLRASSYLPLPKFVMDRKAVLNIKNKDDRCFMWSILASLYPSRGDNCSRVNKYKEHEDKLDMDGMKYPVRIQDINKFERLNNISVSVFAINEDQKIFPLRITTSKDHDCHHVDLLYITDEDGETSHYTLIRDLSRLVSPQINKHNGKMFICNFCLHACQSEEILKRHKERCSLHNAQSSYHNQEKIRCSLTRSNVSFDYHSRFMLTLNQS